MRSLGKVSVGLGSALLLTASLHAAPNGTAAASTDKEQVAQQDRSRGPFGFPDWDSRFSGYDRSRRPAADADSKQAGPQSPDRKGGPPGAGDGPPGARGGGPPPWARGGGPPWMRGGPPLGFDKGKGPDKDKGPDKGKEAAPPKKPAGPADAAKGPPSRPEASKGPPWARWHDFRRDGRGWESRWRGADSRSRGPAGPLWSRAGRGGPPWLRDRHWGGQRGPMARFAWHSRGRGHGWHHGHHRGWFHQGRPPWAYRGWAHRSRPPWVYRFSHPGPHSRHARGGPPGWSRGGWGWGHRFGHYARMKHHGRGGPPWGWVHGWGDRWAGWGRSFGPPWARSWGSGPQRESTDRRQPPRPDPRREPPPRSPAPSSDSRSADLEKRLDRLMRELEELRRDIRRSPGSR